MKEWLRRALRTFLQAALGFVAANLTAYISGVDFSNKDVISSVIIGLVTSSIAAGIAAVMNINTTKTDTGAVLPDYEDESGDN